MTGVVSQTQQTWYEGFSAPTIENTAVSLGSRSRGPPSTMSRALLSMIATMCSCVWVHDSRHATNLGLSANDSGSPLSFSAHPRGSGRTVHRLRRRVLSDQVHVIHIRTFVSLSGATAEILLDGRGTLTTRDIQASPRWSPPRGHANCHATVMLE